MISGLVLALAACGKASGQQQAEPSSKAEAQSTSAKSEQPASEASSAASEASSAASEASSAASEAAPAGAAQLGGWTINDEEYATMLPTEVQEAFDKATEGLLGNELTPVAFIGSQVVSGTNYAVLCRSELVTKEPVISYKVAVIYSDLDGNAEILNIADFNIADYTEGEGTAPADLAGGWSVPEYTVMNMPAEVQSAFDAALEGFTGNNLEPLAYLGSQVVSGTNYAVLCHSSLVTSTPVNSIQVVTVYKDLQGKSTIKNICTIDPSEFNPQ